MTAVSVRRPRLRFTASAATAAATALLAVAGLLLALRVPTWENLVQGHLIGDALASVCCGATGSGSARPAAAASRRPGFLAIGLADAVAVLVSGWQIAAPSNVVVLWSTEWVWRPGLGLLVVILPLLVPDGPRSRFERVIMRTGLGAIVFWTVGGALSSRRQQGRPHRSGIPSRCRSAARSSWRVPSHARWSPLRRSSCSSPEPGEPTRGRDARCCRSSRLASSSSQQLSPPPCSAAPAAFCRTSPFCWCRSPAWSRCCGCASTNSNSGSVARSSGSAPPRPPRRLCGGRRGVRRRAPAAEFRHPSLRRVPSASPSLP